MYNINSSDMWCLPIRYFQIKFHFIHKMQFQFCHCYHRWWSTAFCLQIIRQNVKIWITNNLCVHRNRRIHLLGLAFWKHFVCKYFIEYWTLKSLNWGNHKKQFADTTFFLLNRSREDRTFFIIPLKKGKPNCLKIEASYIFRHDCEHSVCIRMCEMNQIHPTKLSKSEKEREGKIEICLMRLTNHFWQRHNKHVEMQRKGKEKYLIHTPNRKQWLEKSTTLVHTIQMSHWRNQYHVVVHECDVQWHRNVISNVQKIKVYSLLPTSLIFSKNCFYTRRTIYGFAYFCVFIFRLFRVH